MNSGQWKLEEIEKKEMELRGRWVVLKLKLTDWLEKSIANCPIADDYKGIKCIVDATHQLDKMIGACQDGTNSVTDAIDTKERAESILKRLDNRL